MPTLASMHTIVDTRVIVACPGRNFVPNFGIREYMRHTAETDAVFPHAYSFSQGYLHPGDAPGHGVDIDEALAANYPYRAASLLVNRLEDGTLFNW